MFLAYFVHSKEYFNYIFEGDRIWDAPFAIVGTLLPLAITLVGIAIIYYCFRPIKLTRTKV